MTDLAPILDPPPDERRVLALPIVTRGYELNHRGEVSPATLLRYCEHARWESLKHDQAMMATFFARDHYLVVRSQEAELGDPVGFDTRLNLRLWLAGIGSSSVVFGQEVLEADSGRPVARVRVGAVHIGPNGRPAPVPDRWRGAVPSVRAGARAPNWPSVRDETAWRTAVPVRLSDVDVLQHVNHAAYLDMAQFAVFQALRERANLDRDRAAAVAGALGHLHVDYTGQAVLGDEVEILAWIDLPGEPADSARQTARWMAHIRRGPDRQVLCRVLAETRPSPGGASSP